MAKVTFNITMKDVREYISPYELAEAMVTEIMNDNPEYWVRLLEKIFLSCLTRKKKACYWKV